MTDMEKNAMEADSRPGFRGKNFLVEQDKERQEEMQEVEKLLIADYKNGRDIDKTAVFNQPDPETVHEIIKKLRFSCYMEIIPCRKGGFMHYIQFFKDMISKIDRSKS